jgi:excisionase family DNA binding protein
LDQNKASYFDEAKMRRKKQNLPRRNKDPRAAERLLTVRQVAENWEMSERHIRRMIADRRLPVVRLGRAVRIREKEVAR